MNDVTVIGSGPAGLTAAICIARMDLQVEVYTGPLHGGNITLSPRVENFPSFPVGEPGNKLAQQMTEQAQKLGAKLVYDVVTKVDFSSRPLKLWCGEQEIESLAVIIATGAIPKKLGIENEEQLTDFGVSNCATCHGAFYKNGRVMVTGGGDLAMQETLYLNNICSEVLLVSWSKRFHASQTMVNRVRNCIKAQMIAPYQVVALKPDARNSLQAVVIEHTESKKRQDVAVDALFVAIGQEPCSQIFQPYIETDDRGFIIVNNCVETNVPGVFAAGDVTNSIFKQSVVATGNGYQAALAALYYLGA